jgi:nucleoside 2-deoxyribosyltransferase
MRIFIICSVRDIDAPYFDTVNAYARKLEARGHRVHLPPRDTNQNKPGITICRQNLENIRRADEVHIFYNGRSQGTHFDMGMAFALGKPIVVVKNEAYVEGKSFPRMLDEWMEANGGTHNM